MSTLSTPLEQVDTYRWRLPKSGGMRVDGLMPEAYKDVADVVGVVHGAGIAPGSLS